MKNLEQGKPIRIAESIPIKSHHTISKSIAVGDSAKAVLFSMASETDIAAEFYENASIFLVFEGKIEVQKQTIAAGETLFCGAKEERGVDAKADSVYLEILLEGGGHMKNIELGKVISLKDAIEYVEGGISNLDIASGNGVKFMLMAFDKGQGLNPHSAPGDAMVIALEGSATLQVGDEFHTLKAGQQLVFPKKVVHDVQAKDERFKMALLLIMDKEA